MTRGKKSMFILKRRENMVCNNSSYHLLSSYYTPQLQTHTLYFNPHNNIRRYVILSPILHMRSLRLKKFKGLPKVTELEVTKLGFELRFPLD